MSAQAMTSSPTDDAQASATENALAARILLVIAAVLILCAVIVAVFGLFLPFVGIVMGPLAIIMASIARKRAREAGGAVDKNSLVFGIVVTVVWTVLWLFILVPALLN